MTRSRLRPLAALAALLLLALPSAVVMALDQANIQTRMRARQYHFVRALDTLCACVGDTTMGPSVYCFGARKVIFTLRANSGTCSTLTVQVSNNDSTYEAALSGLQVTVVSNFATGDSLNQGGRTVTLVPSDSVSSAGGRLASTLIPWRYARMFARQRVGYTTTTASAGPTVACRTRADSLRFGVDIVWSNP